MPDGERTANQERAATIDPRVARIARVLGAAALQAQPRKESPLAATMRKAIPKREKGQRPEPSGAGFSEVGLGNVALQTGRFLKGFGTQLGRFFKTIGSRQEERLAALSQPAETGAEAFGQAAAGIFGAFPPMTAEELRQQPALAQAAMAIPPAAGPLGLIGGLELGAARAVTVQAVRGIPAATKAAVLTAARGPAAQAVVPVKQAVTMGRKAPKEVIELEAEFMQLTRQIDRIAKQKAPSATSIERYDRLTKELAAKGDELQARRQALAAGQAEMPVAAKEPWQMTKGEYYLSRQLGTSTNMAEVANREHAGIVSRAIAEGKQVPSEVLVPYPYLQAQVAKPVAKAPSTAVPARGRAAKAVAPKYTPEEWAKFTPAQRAAKQRAFVSARPKAAKAAEVTKPVIQPAAAGQGLPPPGTVAPTRAGPLVGQQAAPSAVRQPNLQAGPRAEPIGPPRKPPGPKPFGAAPEELPSGRQPGGIGRQKPTVTAEPLLKAEAALTPQGKKLVERISEGADSIVRGLFAQNAGLRGLPESSIGHPFSLAKVIPASAQRGGAIVTERYAPVLESVADNLKDLATYKMLQRDKDLLSGPKPIRNLPGGLTGMGDVLTAEKQLAQKLGPERFAQVKQASEQLDALNRANVVGRLRQEGIITKEIEQALLAEHPHYLPFQREDFVMGIESRLSMPTASVSSTGLKRMTEAGSTRALHDPLAALVTQPVRIEHIIARNKAARALIESLQELEKNTGERLVSMVGPERLAKEANIGGAFKPDLASIENSNVVGTIGYFKDGVQHQANIPAYYARIAKSLDAEVAGGFVRVMRVITNPFKASVTAYNPAFPLVNLLRDATSFLFNGGLIPFGPSYMRGLKAVLTKNADYIAARDAGTFMSGMIESMDSMSKVRRVIGQHNRGAFTIRKPEDLALLLPRLTRGVGRGIKAFNIVIEQAPRAGQFISARRAGFSALESAVKGRDVTVDFAQFGTVMRTVDAIFPFSNPATQGLYITARTIKNHPVRSAIIAAGFMFPTVLSRVNNMRFETSEKIPNYLYRNNWVVQFGEFTDEKGERMPMYFKIPKGPIAGPATFPAEALFNVARKSEDKSAAGLLLEAGLGSLETLSPIQPSTGAVAPPFGSLVQVQAGKNFFTGLPIVPRREEALLPEQQFGPDVSKAAIAIGQATKISPRVLDFAFESYFGGAGQAVTWLIDMGLGAIGYNPEPFGQSLQTPLAFQKQLSRLPVGGRIFGTTGSQLERRGWEQLRDTVEETNRQFSTIPGMNSLGIKLGIVGSSMDVVPGVKGGSVDLTPQQQNEYHKIMASLVVPTMASYMTTLPSTLSPEAKRELVVAQISTLKQQATDAYRVTIDEYVKAHLSEYSPEFRQLYKEKEIVKPYWDVLERTLAKYPKMLAIWEQWKAMPKGAARDNFKMANGDIITTLTSLETKLRTEMRKKDAKLDAILVKWYGYTPQNDRNLLQRLRERAEALR